MCHFFLLPIDAHVRVVNLKRVFTQLHFKCNVYCFFTIRNLNFLVGNMKMIVMNNFFSRYIYSISDKFDM